MIAEEKVFQNESAILLERLSVLVKINTLKKVTNDLELNSANLSNLLSGKRKLSKAMMHTLLIYANKKRLPNK